MVSLIVSLTKVSKVYFYKCAHFLSYLFLSSFFVYQLHSYTKLLSVISLISTPNYLHSYPYSLYSHSDFPHSHPDSSHSHHSHPDSPHFHHSPHSIPQFPIPSFTGSLFWAGTLVEYFSRSCYPSSSVVNWILAIFQKISR